MTPLLAYTATDAMIAWLCLAIMAAPFVFEYELNQALRKLREWWSKHRR